MNFCEFLMAGFDDEMQKLAAGDEKPTYPISRFATNPWTYGAMAALPGAAAGGLAGAAHSLVKGLRGFEGAAKGDVDIKKVGEILKASKGKLALTTLIGAALGLGAGYGAANVARRVGARATLGRVRTGKGLIGKEHQLKESK